MKRSPLTHLFFTILCLHTIITQATITGDMFQVVLEPQWQNLDNDINRQHDGAWILIGNITFTKKAKDPVSLDRIVLSWQGNTIDQLYGSLFKQDAHNTFLPIEDNVICDGEWSKKRQQLTLKFDQQHKLGHINTFYLVVAIPTQLEPVLKEGNFSVAHEFLPTPFKNQIKTQKITLNKKIRIQHK
jgi:hypothetical protein